jgi:lipoyl(octanoyl) transferase
VTGSIFCCNVGMQAYQPTEALQHELVDWRQRGLIEDVLLLVEHEPVITLGRRADPRHILASPEDLLRQGIVVCQTERGGDVTYHGPGQLVAYPIMNLNTMGIGPSDYMHRLEDVAADTVAEYGVVTHRRPGIIGVWVGDNKIAALGVRIKGGVCFHGLALNVDPIMSHWTNIIACGIANGGVTSLARELGYSPSMSQVQQRFIYHFGQVFGVEIIESSIDQLRKVVESKLESVELGRNEQ